MATNRVIDGLYQASFVGLSLLAVGGIVLLCLPGLRTELFGSVTRPRLPPVHAAAETGTATSAVAAAAKASPVPKALPLAPNAQRVTAAAVAQSVPLASLPLPNAAPQAAAGAKPAPSSAPVAAPSPKPVTAEPKPASASLPSPMPAAQVPVPAIGPLPAAASRTAPAPAPVAPTLTVMLSYSQDEAQNALAFAQHLRDEGFAVTATALASANGRWPGVAYFFQSDRAKATLIAQQLAAVSGRTEYARLSDRHPYPHAGTVEVSLIRHPSVTPEIGQH